MSHEAIDDQLDHIVDTQGVSYHDARQQLGLPHPDPKFFTADRIERRNEATTYYGKEFNLTGPIIRTPEQQAAMRRGRAAVDEVLSETE